MPSITRQSLEAAAFWDHHICLDCLATFEFPAEDGACPECASASLVPASAITALLEGLDESDD